MWCEDVAPKEGCRLRSGKVLKAQEEDVAQKEAPQKENQIEEIIEEPIVCEEVQEEGLVDEEFFEEFLEEFAQEDAQSEQEELTHENSGRPVSPMLPSSSSSSSDHSDDENIILTLSYNGGDWHYNGRKDIKMWKLKHYFGMKTKVPAASCLFFINGKRINDEDTPISLKLESYDIVEVFGCRS